MNEWMNIFERHILNRGFEYAESGCVVDLQIEDETIYAEVEGSELYQVSIELDGKEILDMHCDCPYAQKGYNCKHMAAVLCAYEGMLAEKEWESDEFEETEYPYLRDFENRKKEVEQLIAKIPEEEAKKILMRFIMEDDSLRNKLQLKYDFKMNAKQIADMKKEVHAIVRRYSGRGYYVDWQHASDFIFDLCAFLQDKIPLLLEHNCYIQAFDLTRLVFCEVGTTDIDDSDGAMETLFEECYDYWMDIVERCDVEDKESIRQWFLNNKSGGKVIDYMEEYLQEFYDEAFLSDEEIKARIQMLDEMLAKYKNEAECGSIYSARYGYQDIALLRVKYMRQIDNSDEEVKIFLMKHHNFSSVRKLEVQEALARGDMETAIKILEESKQIDHDSQRKITDISKQLITLYSETGQVEKYRDELRFHLLNCVQIDLTYYCKLKESVESIEEWRTIVDQIISSAKTADYTCKILNYEKRYEELISTIEKSNNVYLLDEYEKSLRKRYPERIIGIYKEYVIAKMERSNSRTQYYRTIQYLKKIAKCSGGKEEAMQIAEKWKSQYKRRTAMLDELRKAGF